MMPMYGHKDEIDPVDEGDDTAWDDQLMTQAMEAIAKRVAVSRKYDVIYLAGTSSDGRIIYIDKDLPDCFTDSKGKEVYIDDFLTFHEMVEQCLMSQLGLRYQLAHQIALRAERTLVESQGVDWDEYDAFMGEWAGKALAKKDPETPPDLDSKPYVDEEDDLALKRMGKDHLSHEPKPTPPTPMPVTIVKRPKRKFSG